MYHADMEELRRKPLDIPWSKLIDLIYTCDEHFWFLQIPFLSYIDYNVLVKADADFSDGIIRQKSFFFSNKIIITSSYISFRP